MASPHHRKRPVLLLILDGWGIAPKDAGNPLAAADTPNLHRLMATFPAMVVHASGDAVGLMWGEQGNSEVGHLTIGAGRVYYQDFPRINMAIDSGAFASNAAFLGAFGHATTNRVPLHIIGIASTGNIHGSMDHLYALLEAAKTAGVADINLHMILDGRDAPYDSGIDCARALQKKMNELGAGRIASLGGRAYAMERDGRWDRIRMAYDAMVGTNVRIVDDPIAEIERSYGVNTYDEEFVPVTIRGGATIQDGHAVIFTNFRPDRMRNLATAFLAPDFNGFRRDYMKNLFFVSMTEYDDALPAHVAFPKEKIISCLSSAISKAGLQQLHIAESEKYAHVTFFLNGLREAPYPGEDRMIINSPHVTSYDKAPEMSTPLIAERIAHEVREGTYDVIIANFANADMVGHTGKFDLTQKAAEILDRAVGQVVDAVLEEGGAAIITADHGKGEDLNNIETGKINKEHSTNPVPVILAAAELRKNSEGEVDLSAERPVGTLADIAPTMLKMLDVEIPPEMTGVPLF